MKVLIVDDHVIVRDALKRLLATIAECRLEEATNGAEALTLAARSGFDLVILDLNLPDLGGVELLRRLRQQSATPILVFSMHAELIYVSRALEAGASGYLSKNAAPDELVRAVRRIVAGGRYVEAELAQALALDGFAAPAGVDQLTARDMEILRLLAGGKSLTQIAEALELKYKTIANTCTLIKAKLGVSRTTDLVRVAVESGVV